LVVVVAAGWLAGRRRAHEEREAAAVVAESWLKTILTKRMEKTVLLLLHFQLLLPGRRSAGK